MQGIARGELGNEAANGEMIIFTKAAVQGFASPFTKHYVVSTSRDRSVTLVSRRVFRLS